MFRGILNPEQALALREVVTGRHVHDLGAGDFALSGVLIELGATGVTAVDKEYRGAIQVGRPHKVRVVGSYFEEYFPDALDVAFISWPNQYATPGLERLARQARTVVYLGSNFDSTACGSKELWETLRLRSVTAEVRHPRNTLIVYGAPSGLRRLLPEEYAGTYRNGPYFRYDSLSGPEFDLLSALELDLSRHNRLPKYPKAAQ